MNGMVVDNNLLETLTQEQYEYLSKNSVYKTSAIYQKGNDAYIVGNTRPNFVAMNVALWSNDLTTIQGSSSSMVERDAAKISPNSGMMFHTINGELYAYSSGDIRDNPSNFKSLISELVEQVGELVIYVKENDDSDTFNVKN
ncbi:hypothetical protein N478_03465 [Pseudoalteromonas luteoviolacea S4060-1]|uniref:Uncharacterized protein n=2 Tax=Pseudoalteromonas luteoviolacea TaxID=43657 RepID=A0A167KV16_9GAMM|nr:hypothetical protein N478_03465 [Pseudoalteromonas luteoviolacea S4060-1]